MTENLVQEVQDADTSRLFPSLQSQEFWDANEHGKYSGINTLLRYNPSDKAGVLWLALVGEWPWCWIPTWGAGWRCIEETDLSGKNNVFILWYLGATTSFRCCGFVWIGVGGPCVGPVVWFWSSVSVHFLRRCFPLRQHKSRENFLDTSPHQCTVTILTWFLSSAIPHVWLMFIFLTWRRCWGQWPKLLTLHCWKANRQRWVFPVWLLWTPKLHLSLSVEIPVVVHGVPSSVFLPGRTRAPEVQTVSIILRWSQWSRNPGQT